MSTPDTDTIRVPQSSNIPPYRLDETSEHDHYVRIRRPGGDLLVLVPPGDCGDGFRTRLVAELQAFAARGITARRFKSLVTLVLSVVVPLLLMAACIAAAAAGISPFPAGSVLSRAVPVVTLALLAGCVVVLLAPRYSLIEQATSVAYPRDPADALEAMPEAGIRYLTEDDLRGDAALEALRHDVLNQPASIRSEEWAALWALAARDDHYPSALVTVRDLARLRLEASARTYARSFSAQMQVAMEGFESALTRSPPTSPGDSTEDEEAS